MAHEIDVRRAPVTVIHKIRLDAKRLRYTLEAFEGALGRRAQRRIEQVTGLQDAAGAMHDAAAAADRARALMAGDALAPAERRGVASFAVVQERCAADLRPTIADRLRTVRAEAFRADVGRLVTAMGDAEHPAR